MSIPNQPQFDPGKFQQVLMGCLMRWVIPLIVLFFVMQSVPNFLPRQRTVSETTLLGLPLVHARDGVAVGIFAQGGLAIGIVAMGGLAVGVLAFGGAAVGILAFGGGAIGVVSIGGGSLGLFAIGGGACGLIAIGGGAVGRVAIGGGAAGIYVLAGSGRGRHVLDMQRQDPEAVEFFCRYLPRLRAAWASPVPGEGAPNDR